MHPLMRALRIPRGQVVRVGAPGQPGAVRRGDPRPQQAARDCENGEAVFLEETPRFADNGNAFFKNRAGTLVSEKIEITLAVARLNIL